MPSVHDVAAYILRQKGVMTTWKLQKLVYYCQAWSLVWDERPLFSGRIEAWANGPVCPALYRHHRTLFSVRRWEMGDADAISGEQKATVDGVLNFYGDKPGSWLAELTHRERPWLDARQGLPPGARSNALITHAAMAEYYGSL